MNVPYVKKYDENGLVTNPIEKEYLNSEPNRRYQRSEFKERKRNNTQGVRCIVSRIGIKTFVKYKVIEQKIGNKIIQHMAIAN